jgi:hypothetical protein
MQRFNETKSWFSRKINKNDTSLANLTKTRRDKTQINKIRYENCDISTNNNEIPRITREYFENLYSNILENLHKMDKFLDAFDKSKWAK